MMYHGESFFGTVKSTCLQREPHQSKKRMCLPIQSKKLGFDSLTVADLLYCQSLNIFLPVPSAGPAPRAHSSKKIEHVF